MRIVNNSTEGTQVGYVSDKNIDIKSFDYINDVTLRGIYEITLSYTDLMVAVNKFPQEYGASSSSGENMDESEIVLTPDQEKIQKTKVFNVTALGKLVTKKPGEPSETIYFTDKRSDYIIIQGTSMSSIEKVGSYGFFNISELKIVFDVDSYVKAYIESNPSVSSEDVTTKAVNEFIWNTFNIPLSVADINDNVYSLMFHITIKPTIKSNEEKEDKGNTSWPVETDENGQDLRIVSITNDYYLDYVFINSMSLRELSDYNKVNGGYHINGPCIVLIKIDERCSSAFSFVLNMDGTEIPYSYTPSFSSLSSQNIEYDRVTKMNGPDVSYALLRTNPKLTGNVKVVVDSNSNIYLDTFKVSTALSQKQYRHVKVASSDYYGENLMSRYKNIPSTDFYKVEGKCYSLFTPVQTYKEEYYDLYRMGAKTNDDEMYSENFSIFAPICLKSHYPDFFVVFKIDKDLLDTEKNTRLYDEDKMSDIEKLNYFIKYGTVVKSFDMRPGSKLGSYIETIIKHNENYVGEIYESYDTGNYNKIIGISLDKGAVTGAYESVYPEEKLTNQVQLNDYYTNGFERNHLVSKNIINFEFMFDDPNAELFSINTYFGLYLKVNTGENTYSCIDVKDGCNVFDSSINTFSKDVKNLRETFADSPIIYGITTPKEFIRLNTNICTSSEVNKYMKLPYKNIYNSSVKQDDACSIITFTLHDLLTKGDHIRFVFNSSKEIYEIICSNTPWYSDENFVTDVITNQVKLGRTEYAVKRVSLYLGNPEKDSSNNIINDNDTYDKNEVFNLSNKDSKIKDTVSFIYAALTKLFKSSKANAYKLDDYTIGVKTKDADAYFERICSPSGFDITQKEYIYSTTDEDKTISVFNDIYIQKAILNLDNNIWKSSDYKFLYPLNFEILGSRMAYICKFISSEGPVFYGEIPNTKAFDNKTILYQNLNNEYTIYDNFKVCQIAGEDGTLSPKFEEYKYLPYIKSGKYILNVHNPKLVNGTLCLYTAYPLNDGVCSIFNIKDFDFNVLDAESKVLCNDTSNVIDITASSGISGEYAEKSVFNGIEPEDPDEPEPEDSYICRYSYNELLNDNEIFNKVYEDLYGENGKYRNVIESYGFYESSLEQSEENEKAAKTNLVYAYVTIKPYYPNTSIEDMTHIDYNRIIRVYPWIDTFNDTDISESERYDDDTEFYKIPQNQYILGSTLWYTDVVTTGNFPVNAKLNNVFVDTGAKFTDSESTVNTFIMPSEYLTSTSPIRNTNEEQFKDYIDKNRITDVPGSNISFKTKTDINNSLLTYFKENHKSFDISLISPHACKWKSIGTDARGKNYRLMYYDKNIDIITDKEDMKNKSYYLVGPDSYSSYVGYLYDSDYAISEKLSSKYIGKSVNAVVKTDSSIGMRVKDALLTKKISIDDLLCNATYNNTKMSVAYINGDNCLEFISSGVKINIKSTNDNAINLNNYNGYSAAFVVMNDSNFNYAKDTEIIIDETKREILLIWYLPANTFKYGLSYDDTPFESSLNDKTKYYISYLPNAPLFENIKTGYIKGINGKEYVIAKYLDQNNLVNTKLCKNAGAIYISSVSPSKDSYTGVNRLVCTGKISNTEPIPASMTSLDVYPYYIADNNITMFETKFWHNNINDALSTNDISSYAHDYSAKIDYLLMSDDPSYIINNVSTFNKLNIALNNHSIYIKTQEGKKDYTNLQGILEVNAVNPLVYQKKKLTSNPDKLAYVHSTYGEPVMKDMIAFDYVHSISDTIESSFKRVFSGGNISVADVNTINQMWINKYTELNDYCGSNIDLRNNTDMSLRTSVDVVHNKSIMNSSWSKNEYRKYYLDTTDNNEKIESYENVDGYITGYETKHFLNSRGIQLKAFNNGIESSSQTFELSSWKNTSISKLKNYIRLDISDSIVYKLINNDQYMKTWNYLKISSNNYKINYIKKTILPLLNINNKTKIVLKRNSEMSDSFNFSQDYDDSMIAVDNYSNNLVYENGKYYMYIYPEDNYTYYAKMIINL